MVTGLLSRRCVIVFAALLSVGVASTSVAVAATGGPCVDILPSNRPGAAPPRRVEPVDLVTLRDIGPSVLGSSENLIGLSADGSKAAFVLYRADPVTNSICQALIAVDVREGARAIVLDSGGEPDFSHGNLRGSDFRTGTRRRNLPAWSPDGRWVAYLKRIGGVTQVWAARADGSEARASTRSKTDVEGVVWSPDGKSLIFTTRAGVEAQDRAIASEGVQGYLFDERFVPGYEPTPLVSGDLPSTAFAVEFSNGQQRLASAGEAALVSNKGIREGAAAISSDGKKAWVARGKSDSGGSRVDLWAEDALGKPVRCADPACVVRPEFGFSGLWWTRNGREVVFARREGPGEAFTSLYRWVPERGPPKRILQTEDQVVSCVVSHSDLLCAREGSKDPRYLTLIDTETGKGRMVFDPNPEFRHLIIGDVKRYYWKNNLGIDAYGDLVLPPNYRKGARLPLIVVQYKTKGFLRGGTGDDAPIQVFAVRGYAVLSVSRPLSVETTGPTDMSDSRSVLSGLEVGIQILVKGGIVDEKRIGITGHSNGAGTARYAILHTPIAAASVSSCCFEGRTMMIYGGISAAGERNGEDVGGALNIDGDLSALNEDYLAMSAKTVDTPILMQLADRESLYGLEAFMALRGRGKPVEMFIYPDEYHNKWQPAHKLAIYERNIDWFDFWLMNRRDGSPEKVEQYRRWALMPANKGR